MSSYAERIAQTGYSPQKAAHMADRRESLSRRTEAARGAYDKVPEEHQKGLQNKLKQLQKAAPKLTQEAAKSFVKGRPTWKLVKGVFSIFRQIDLSRDWAFIPVLVSFALLKDIFDIAFAGVPGVGVILQFITEIFLIIYAATALFLTGDKWVNRGMTKYFLGMVVAFISEALPGIGWLPLSVIEAFIFYGFVLLDRASQSQTSPEKKPAENAQTPAYATADQRAA